MAASGWRRGDVPAWALALGIVVVCGASLLLASFGAVGIAVVAVLLLAVIGLFRLFVGVDVPRQERSSTDQPG